MTIAFYTEKHTWIRMWSKPIFGSVKCSKCHMTAWRVFDKRTGLFRYETMFNIFAPRGYYGRSCEEIQLENLLK